MLRRYDIECDSCGAYFRLMHGYLLDDAAHPGQTGVVEQYACKECRVLESCASFAPDEPSSAGAAMRTEAPRHHLCGSCGIAMEPWGSYLFEGVANDAVQPPKEFESVEGPCPKCNGSLHIDFVLGVPCEKLQSIPRELDLVVNTVPVLSHDDEWHEPGALGTIVDVSSEGGVIVEVVAETGYTEFLYDADIQSVDVVARYLRPAPYEPEPD